MKAISLFPIKAFLVGIVLFASSYSFGQISAPTASSTTTTAYTNGAPNNSIYMFCAPNQSVTNIASLTGTAPSGTAPFTFSWSLFNSATYSFDPYTTTTGTSSVITAIPTGGYFLSIKDAGGNPVGCYIAWAFNNFSNIDVANIPSSCAAFQLNGTASPVANFVYYNPPSVDQMLISATTTITVCFNATHTYVSDLGFYLVSPCGQTIPLSPNPGSIGQNNICNSGDNVNNLCFSNSTAADLNVCSATTPLTGTYGHYGVAPGTAINWVPLYGCDAAQGGWKVQIYDCIGADVGSLTHATITFTGMTPCGIKTISYNSGAISSAINDNSCTAASASQFVVPPVNPSPISLATPNTITSFQWTCNNPCVTIPNATTSLSPTISPVPTSATWFYLTAVDNMGCNHLVDSALFTPSCPCPISAVTKNILPCNSGPNTFDITGQVTFTNPPCTGQLIVTTCSGAQQVFNAPFTSPISYTLTGIVSDGTPGCTVTANFTNGPAGCTFSTATFTEPTPVLAVITDPAAVCASSTVDLTAAAVTAGSTAGGTFSYWTNAGGTTALGSPGAVTTSGTYYIRNTVGSCSDIKPVNVTVNPAPTVTVPANFSVCDGTAVPAPTLTSTPVGATYSWTNSNPAIGLGAGTTGSVPAFTATNSTASPITGVITVTPTLGSCPGTASSYTITVNPTPTIGVNNATICPGQTAILTATGGTGYVWDDLSTANPRNVSPIVASTYTVTGTVNGCSDTAIATVAIGGSITITVTSDTICVGGTAVLTASGAAGYTWFDGSTTNPLTISPTVTTSYLVTGSTSGCTGTATATVRVNPLAVANVPANDTVCNNGSIAGTAFTSTPAGGTFTWTNSNPSIGLVANGIGDIAAFTATNTTSSPVTATIAVTATANGCTGLPVTYTITVNPTPTVIVPADTTVCNGGTVVASNFTSTTTGASYTWTNSDPSIGLVASGTGNVPAFTAANITGSPVTATITVTPMANGCAGTPSTYHITVNPPPPAPTAAGVSVCANTPATLTATAPGGTYDWYNAASGGTLLAGNTATYTTPNIPSATTFYVQTTVGGCVSALTPVTVSIAAGLTVNAGADDTICFGGSTVLNVTPNGAGYTYSWTPAATLTPATAYNPTANPATTTSYTVKVTSAGGCIGYDTVTVFADPQINLAIAGLPASCHGSCDGQSIVIPNGGSGIYSTYAWSGGCTTPACNQCAGNDTVIVTDSWGCTATNNTTISEPTALTETHANTNASCFGVCDGTATVTPAGGTPAAAGYNYSWNTLPVAQTTATATGLCAGTYICTITDSHSCSVTATVIITEPTQVVLTPVANVTICNSGSTTISTSASGGNGGIYHYLWTPTNDTISNPVVSPAVTTVYTVNATDANGCPAASQTVTVTVNPPLAVATAGTAAICPGSTTPISATPSNGAGGSYTVSWLPVAGLDDPTSLTPNATPATTTTYTVTANDGCSPAVTNTVTVTVLPLPVPVFTANATSGCAPLCATFTDASTISSGSISGWGWDFNDGALATGSTAIHCFANPNQYTVTLTDTSAAGCIASVTYTNYITVNAIPHAVFTAPASTGIVVPVVPYTDQSTVQSGSITSWNWNFGETGSSSNTSHLQNPSHTFSEVGTYCAHLVVTSNNGCVDSTDVCIVIDPEFTFFVPNAFSPNGDGINDEFYGKGDFIHDFEMSIYDRWGNLLFFTDDIDKHWNGTANHGNEVAQMDTYVYVIKLKDNKDKKHQYIGSVTLVK
ncbi:MAG: hypothetical protein JWP12_2105 [Bacteroidetes bacterium]|nr:hypothetical protein [Bacteroidota bacterium]